MKSIKSQNSGANDNQLDNQMQLLDKDFKGQIFNNIVGFVHNYLRGELICVQSDVHHELLYHRIRIQKETHHDGSTTATGLTFDDYVPHTIDPKKNRKSLKFGKGPRIEPAAFNSPVI
jgi:hypothetical protein